MQVTYKCNKCEKVFRIEKKEASLEEKCPDCQSSAFKQFSISVDMEDGNISHVIEMMKYAKNPSGKDKTVI